MTNQERFMEWLADRVPSSSLSDYFFVVSDVENYAHKKYVFSGALYDVVDPTVSGKLVATITADKFFKFMHKRQMKTITSLVEMFHKYTKENALTVTQIQSENAEGNETLSVVADTEAMAESIESVSPEVQISETATIEGPSSITADIANDETDAPAVFSDNGVQENAEEAEDVTVDEERTSAPPEKPVNKTYFRDDMEQFYVWLGQNSSLSVQERKSLISALRIAQLFLQENIAPELALFSDDPSIVKVSINALLSDPDFKAKNDERQGRYFVALETLREFNARRRSTLAETANATCGQELESENAPTVDSNIDGRVNSNTVQQILSDHKIPFWKASKGYLFVERKDMPDVVMRAVRRSEDVISVTSVRRYGNKDCWRIRIREKEAASEVPDEQATKMPASNESSIGEATDRIEAVIGSSSPNSEPEATGESEGLVDIASVRISNDDPLLAFLEQMGVSYIDNRPKAGRLWIIGNRSLKDTTTWLKSQGYSFIYCNSGSKSTNWESAWFLDDRKAQKSQPENTADETLPPKESKAVETTETALSTDLLQLLSDDDMQLLRDELARQSITTLEQFKRENLWAFMNRYALYPISQRLDVYKRVLQRLNGTRAEDHDSQFKLETKSTAYYGDTPAEAFASFCEHIAQKYPLKIRTLLDAKYRGQGSVVLSRTDSRGDSLKMMNPVAYIRKDLSTEAVIVYGHWISEMCGDNDPPVKLTPPSKSRQSKKVVPELKKTTEPVSPAYSSPPKLERVPIETPTAKQEKVSEDEIGKAEQIVKKADLDGISFEELSEELRATMVSTRRTVAAARHIVQLGDKLIHDEAFVDWEEGADQLERILEKLLARNDGYVSRAQLYEFARSEMQVFLNDNDLDDPRLIFDMAQHLFEKIDYHGKHLVFQSKSHISRGDLAVTNVLDLMKNYAVSQGGVFAETDLAQYLQSVGVGTGNMRGLMKVYTHPIFMFYDKGQFIYGESMGINEDWFTTVKKALDALFDDMGDHIVLRDIQSWWFAQLPNLPAGRSWTLLLFQSVLSHYSDKLNGAHTISALSGQSVDTIHAMLVSKDSEIQTFPDAVAAFLIDDGIEQRYFEAEDLRQLLLKRGMIIGNELIWNMHKALANDTRFAWDADGQHVFVKV